MAESRGPSTTSVVLLRVLLEAAARAGVRRDEMLATLGLEPRLLDDSDATIPGPLLMRAWDEAALRSGDPAFGLHVGAMAAPGSFEVVDYAVLASATVREGVQRMARYSRILTDHVSVTLEEGNPAGEARLVHRVRGVHPERGARHAWECFFAASVVRFRAALGAAWSPTRVELAHRAPADAREHEQFFRAPVLFGRATNLLAFDAAVLGRPGATSDPALARVMVRFAEALYARRERAPDTPIERARATLEALLRGGEPSLARLAARMGTSARTLQRQLEAEGTSYHALLDETRFALARAYLADARVSLTEVSYLLGFAQLSAFQRAFRRWSGGRSPAAFRAEALRASTGGA